MFWDKICSWLGWQAGAGEMTAQGVPDKKLLEREIAAWLGSPERVMQIKGHLYYSGEQDILSRRRTAIGENGQLQLVENLPNNRVIDNQYAKLVNQKANYLLGQPFVLECENKQYLELLRQVSDKRFMRTLKNAGKTALCGGIAWLYPYFDGEGKLAFRLFPAYEMLPFWQDSEHNTLSWAVRFYQVWDLSNGRRELQDKVEVYSLQGVQRYIWQGRSEERRVGKECL